jgi:outer membrane lipoprotein-sorting protein
MYRLIKIIVLLNLLLILTKNLYAQEEISTDIANFNESAETYSYPTESEINNERFHQLSLTAVIWMFRLR